MSKDAIKDLEERVSYSLLHTDDHSPIISQVDLADCGDAVFFVYLSGNRLYTAADKTLYVYSMSDLTSPIATYPLGGTCESGMIIDDHLYLGIDKELHMF